MGRVSGDKSRYNRERRKKLAQRERMRALRATLDAKAAATPQPKAGAATKIPALHVRPREIQARGDHPVAHDRRA